jgi:hypothetical protein
MCNPKFLAPKGEIHIDSEPIPLWYPMFWRHKDPFKFHKYQDWIVARLQKY